MKQSTGLQPLVDLVNRHHPTIFFVVVVLSISLVLFSLYTVVSQILLEPIEAESTITSFDKKTIKMIQDLHVSSDAVDPITLPSPRSNPFVE